MMKPIFNVALLISIAFIVTSVGAAQNVEANEIRYTDLYSGESVYIDQKNKTIQYLDLISKFETCQNDDQYLCFTSVPIVFAILKERNKLKVGCKWIYNDLHYELKEIRTSMVFGRKEQLYVINSNIGNINVVYFYSYESGLIAFGRLGHNRLLILENKSGILSE